MSHLVVRTLSIALSLWASAAAHASDELAATLAQHFAAVSNRDLPALERTLTSSGTLELYLPNGQRTATRAEFVQFHSEWFKSKTWTMKFEPVSQIETAELAVVTVKTYYEDIVESKPYRSEGWLTLIFRREKDEWRLVHDQNTRIRASTDASGG